MKLKLLLFILFSSFVLNLFSQNFYNKKAEEIVASSKFVKLDPKTNTVKFIEFNDRASNRIKGENAGYSLKKSLKLKNNYELKKKSEKADKSGFIHTKYNQYYNGVPIEGKSFSLHYKKGKLISGSGEYCNIDIGSTTPSITYNQAFKIALDKVKANEYVWDYNKSLNKSDLGGLIITFINERPILSYKIDIFAYNPMSRFYIYVDAKTGEFIKKVSRILNNDVVGTAETMYNGTKPITTDYDGSVYRLTESGRGGGIETLDLNNNTNYSSAIDFTDADNYWNTTTNFDNAAYDAHVGTEATYDYFMNIHSRNSFDDAGAKLTSYVHYSSGYVNAFWNGSFMTYGDGDGVNYYPLTCVDIIAHEITHGVTEYSAGLVYSYESGALNESFSDIFGTCVDFYLNPGTANWLCGDQISALGTPIRSLEDPNSQGDPDTYQGNYWNFGSSDNGGVHTNSGVMNYWFYLLTNGGTGVNDNGDSYSISGIGIDKAAKIAYRNLNVYLTANSQYADARFYAIQSAIDLYGDCSPEVIAVTNAWYAVGVGANFSNSVIADFNASQTFSCDVPATISFSNLSTNGLNYIWDFGDGTSSTDINPIKTFNSTGIYDVQLIANGSALCNNADTITKNGFITIADIGGPGIPNCTPGTTSAGDFGIRRFIFNTIDHSSGTSTEAYQDNSCSYITTVTEGKEYSISINTHPTSPENVWVWIDLNNDGAFENSSELIYTSLNNTGTHSGNIILPEGTVYDTPLRLRVASDSSPNIIVDACAESVNGQIEDYSIILKNNVSGPEAKFTSDKKVVETGNTVNFTDQTLNLPTSWSWQFPGGVPSVSAERNPSVIYPFDGTYDVSLIVANTHGADTVVYANYINVSNTYTMCSDNSTSTFSGLLYDSGGSSGYYSNNENCSFLINPGCADTIILSFNTFQLEGCCDYLSVYDGVDDTGTLLMSVNGTNIPAPVTAISGSMFIKFTSDNSATYPGFEAQWESIIDTIGPKPNADFDIANSNPLFNTDVLFNDLTTQNPVNWLWELGDGTYSIQQNPTHKYTVAGVKQVKLSINACTGVDSITKSITVQSAPELTVSSDTLQATILSCDETITVPFTIGNVSGGDLAFDVSLVQDFFDDCEDNTENWITEVYGVDDLWHISDLNPHSSISSWWCGITGSDDYSTGNTINTALISPTIDLTNTASSALEFWENYNTEPGWDRCMVDISIDGGSTWTQLRGTGVSGSSSGWVFTSIDLSPYCGNLVKIRFYFHTGDAVANDFPGWFIDEIKVSNTNQEDWLTCAEVNDIISSGDSKTINVGFNSNGLQSGEYSSRLIVRSNDPNNSDLIIPCILNLIGKPQTILSETSFNFGDIYTNGTKSDTLYISNDGCDTLKINSIECVISDFSVNKSALNILPGDTSELIITFSPTKVASFYASLKIFSNDVEQKVILAGNGLDAPVIKTIPAEFNVTITECNDSTILPLTISNIGGDSLKFQIEGSKNNMAEVVTLTYGVDNSWEYPNTLAAINQYYTAYNLTEIYTTDAATLESVLIGKDVLLIAEQENGSPYVFSNFQPVLQSFVDGGGTVIFCGTYNSDCIFNTGLFSGSYNDYAFGYLDVVDQLHPITEQIPPTINAQNATFTYNINDPDAKTLISYSGIYDVVSVREIGKGKAILVGYDFYEYDDNAAKIIANSVKYGAGGSLPKWLSLSDDSDTITASKSMTIDAKFSAKGVSSGTYTTDLILKTNDPLNPEYLIPCTFTVKNMPVEPTSVTATNTDICTGSSTRLYFLGGSGTSFEWFEGTCGSTPIGYGNNLQVSPTATTTYFGRWVNSCGVSNCLSVTIIVDQNGVQVSPPNSVNAVEREICNGTSTTLSYKGGSGDTFGWYRDACGSTLVGIGNNLEVTPAINTTYYGRWENVCGVSQCEPITIIVKEEPFSPISLNSSAYNLCTGSSATISYVGGSGEIFEWSTGSCDGEVLSTGNNIVVSPDKTTTYYGKWSNSCGVSSCNIVTILVESEVEAPSSLSSDNPEICPGYSSTLSYSDGSGEEFVWYSGSCGGISEGKGNQLSVSPDATTTYYGRWEGACGVSECETITIVMNSNEVAPESVSASEIEVCPGSATALSYYGGTGDVFEWYSGACGEVFVGEGNELSVSPNETTTYYGRWKGNCGESNCKSIKVLVKPTTNEAELVSATNTEICKGIATNLSYAGGTGDFFRWYSGTCGDNLIGTGKDVKVMPEETTTFFGRWENSCDNSICKTVTINVQNFPEKLSAINGNSIVCEGATESFSVDVMPDITYNWNLPNGWSGSSSSNDINVQVGSSDGIIKVTASNICGSSEASELYINIGAQTNIIKQPQEVNSQIGNNVLFNTIAEGENLSYQWRLNGENIIGANESSYQISSISESDLGDYIVLVTGACGEVLSNTAKLGTTNSFENLAKFSTKVYPNPSSGKFTIETSLESPVYKVEVYNVIGKKVYSESFSQKLKVIDISNQAKGVYFIKFEAGDKSGITKLVHE